MGRHWVWIGYFGDRNSNVNLLMRDFEGSLVSEATSYSTQRSYSDQRRQTHHLEMIFPDALKAKGFMKAAKKVHVKYVYLADKTPDWDAIRYKWM